jgi:hypothetical protein
VLTFVCWKWEQPGAKRDFRSEHVNVLASMLRRHYAGPHRLVCVTDKPDGLDAAVEVMDPPAAFESLVNVSGEGYPNCYRRLWNFSAAARDAFGPRMVSIDIDCVIASDITPLFETDETFVGWRDERFNWDKIAGGIYYLRTGFHADVWDEFHPVRSLKLCRKAGIAGSDQAWITYKLRHLPGRWTSTAGLCKATWVDSAEGVRIAFTTGVNPPWSVRGRRKSPWIVEHWR